MVLECAWEATTAFTTYEGAAGNCKICVPNKNLGLAVELDGRMNSEEGKAILILQELQ